MRYSQTKSIFLETRWQSRFVIHPIEHGGHGWVDPQPGGLVQAEHYRSLVCSEHKQFLFVRDLYVTKCDA